MISLLSMGFTSYAINISELEKVNFVIQSACERLIDEEYLAREWGNRFREIE